MLALCSGQRAAGIECISNKNPSHDCWLRRHRSWRQIAFALPHLQQLETDTFTDEDGRAVHEHWLVFRSFSHDPRSGLAEILGVLQLNVCAKPCGSALRKTHRSLPRLQNQEWRSIPEHGILHHRRKPDKRSPGLLWFCPEGTSVNNDYRNLC